MPSSYSFCLAFVQNSQPFTSGVTPSSQCTSWTSYVATLIVRPYTGLVIRGSADAVGVAVTDPTVIAGIALALRTSGTYGPVTSNGRSWAVGACGGGSELSANGAVCQCATGYVFRPCIGNLNWGGVNGATCSAATQTITVEFQY